MIKGSIRIGAVVLALLGTMLVPSFSGTAAATHSVINITPSCGDVVGDAATPQFTTFRLTANVGPCPEFGLFIGADRVELDLNGKRIFGCPSPSPTGDGSYTVTANVPAVCEHLIVTQTATTPLRSSAVPLTSGTGDGAGVLLGATKDPNPLSPPNKPLRDPLGKIVVTPRSEVAVVDTAAAAAKGRIEFFDAGIAIEGGNLNRVGSLTSGTNHGVTVVDNVGSRTLTTSYGDGIYINNSTATDVRDSIVDRNGPFSGITVLGRGSQNNILDNNKVRDNNVTTYNYLSTPQLYYPQDMGIRLEPATNDGIVTDNTVTGNGLDGISVFTDSRGNIIARNYVANNGNHGKNTREGDGIRIWGSYVSRRTVPQASLAVSAIATTSVGGNEVYENIVCANSGNGIVVMSSGNIINDNQAGDGAAKAAWTGGGNCAVNATGPAPPTDFGNLSYFDLHDATFRVETAPMTTPSDPGHEVVDEPCLANIWFDNTWTTRSNICID